MGNSNGLCHRPRRAYRKFKRYFAHDHYCVSRGLPAFPLRWHSGRTSAVSRALLCVGSMPLLCGSYAPQMSGATALNKVANDVLIKRLVRFEKVEQHE